MRPSWEAPQSVEQMFEALTKAQEALSGISVSSIALNKLVGDYMAILDNPVQTCLLGVPGLRRQANRLAEGFAQVVEYTNALVQSFENLTSEDPSEDTE